MEISMLMRWNNQDKYFILICKLSFLQAFYNYQNNLDLQFLQKWSRKWTGKGTPKS